MKILPTSLSQFKRKHVALFCLAVLLALSASYFLTAYEFIPSAWKFVERTHPALNQIGKRAFTAAGIPGDPFNVAFVGTEEELHQKMRSAGWYPADPITLASSLRIAKDSVFHKPYPDAPVSDLFVNGHKQDAAFEQADGNNPSKRHHVRFWKTGSLDALNRPFWIGAATYDAGVGLSHTTGRITHHIAAEIDKERDKLVADLVRDKAIAIDWIAHFQDQLQGKNGGGDKFVTDGNLVVIKAEQ